MWDVFSCETIGREQSFGEKFLCRFCCFLNRGWHAWIWRNLKEIYVKVMDYLVLGLVSSSFLDWTSYCCGLELSICFDVNDVSVLVDGGFIWTSSGCGREKILILGILSRFLALTVVFGLVAESSERLPVGLAFCPYVIVWLMGSHFLMVFYMPRRFYRQSGAYLDCDLFSDVFSIWRCLQVENTMCIQGTQIDARRPSF